MKSIWWLVFRITLWFFTSVANPAKELFYVKDKRIS